MLVVDDHVDSAELAAFVLKGRGHVVRVAACSDEALITAIDFRPDVAIVDIRLGLESGYVLAKHLRSLPGLAGLRLIAATGYVGSDVRAQGEVEGVSFFRCLTKPIGTSALHAAVEDESE